MNGSPDRPFGLVGGLCQYDPPYNYPPVHSLQSAAPLAGRLWVPRKGEGFSQEHRPMTSTEAAPLLGVADYCGSY